MLSFALAALLALATPWNDWRWTGDRRESDGDRYVEFCVGQYQIPETWTCVDVDRPKLRRQTAVR